ncbi:MAG: heme oxygenase (biliverdin-producing) [Calothrix sp. MO_167.B12]|nr:heme oxygenase (biliverdin-producing) [Calothrix sp. MO_167.B12]
MSSNLAAKLRTGTQKSHTAAENVGFMKCFVKGVVDKDCFAKLLSNLYFVYGALEAGIENNRNHPVVGVMYFPELNRQAALEEDMEFYYGKQWRSQIKPSPATQTYLNRLQQLVTHAPELLIGHAYTRYMGDLSGGQMLQAIAQSGLKLTGFQGTSFYNFEQIPDKKVFKDKYRQALNSVPVDDGTADKIVAEAHYAFQLNMQMMQELEGSLIQAIGQVMFNTLTSTRSVGSTEVATS